jgi:uncharacterized membrane protein
MPLFQITAESSRVWLLALLGLTFAGTALVLLWIGLRLVPVYRRTADGGASASGGAPVGDRTPDSRWKGGLFYYAPDDPAIFIEKRFGIGYTVNLARPAVWLVLLLLTAAPFLLALGF